ncbi:hypothetical protein FBUS_00133 [Fasciolopsis buskii]|uniref:Uncharacterized protein n=1 Tax=Fasciolopsis buskii TaxID=27845 RepID=A0A8E0RXT4_9TREM|nr:hypothetical protein FBUS_00133 [Fasciolopsis buski]
MKLACLKSRCLFHSYVPSDFLICAPATSSDSVSARQRSADQDARPQLAVKVPLLVSTENEPYLGGQTSCSSEGKSIPSAQSISTQPSVAGTPDYCSLFALPNYNALVDQHQQRQPCTAAVNEQSLHAVKSRLASAQSDLARLRSELAGLHRAQTACMDQHKEATDNAMERIKVSHDEFSKRLCQQDKWKHFGAS